MISEHTPGEWVAITGPAQPAPTYRGLIAMVECSPDGYKAVVTESCREVTKAEWDANARLIAAAPALLEALQGLVSQAEADGRLHPQHDMDCGCDWSRAKTALSLATGQQSQGAK